MIQSPIQKGLLGPLLIVRHKKVKPMYVASIKSCSRIASSLRDAMLSAQSRDFGMLDTSSCAPAITGDKEHQACRQSSRSAAFFRHEKREPHSNRCSNLNHGGVGAQFGVAVSFRLTAEQNIRSRTSRSKPTGPKRPAF